MKHLSSFSLLANISNFGALFAVLMQDYKVFRSNNDDDNSNHAIEKDEPIYAVRWNGFLYIIAITIYAMEGAGMILSLEASCKERARFPWLLRFMLALISIFMCLFGTAGYAAFGEHTLAPVTLNLGDDHFWAATFVKCALCLGKCEQPTNQNKTKTTTFPFQLLRNSYKIFNVLFFAGLYLTYPVMMYVIFVLFLCYVRLSDYPTKYFYLFYFFAVSLVLFCSNYLRVQVPYLAYCRNNITEN
jgi:hypothetical protein